MSRENTAAGLDFGEPGLVDGSLSDNVRGLVGSEILRIAAEIRAQVAQGRPVCNLTVGDFDPKLFPIPSRLQDRIRQAYAAGETNYPPSDGVPSLRRAVAGYVAREWGVRYPVDSILIASGARPILYAAFRCVLNPGDTVVYPVPSWNNNHYAWLSGARAVQVPTTPDRGFMPTLEQFEPYLAEARLICVNSPLNPAGTVMAPDELRRITRAVTDENARRARAGRPSLFLLHDQVYAALVFGDAKHVHPVALVPEAAPWVISLDGVSKAFAATGLRVGWVLAAPAVVARMRDLLGHVGAWAPRPEQVAFADFLDDAAACEDFRTEMRARVHARLDALDRGLEKLKADGLPVDRVRPQGTIYMSMRLDVIGRRLNGESVATNEDLRRILLERAGTAVVPFQAFGLNEDTGWFRTSVGAVSLEDIEKALPRVRTLLESVTPA
jgi:aspartate aminotransferase